MLSTYVKGDKECRSCGKTKDYRSYHRASVNKDGYENRCKTCKKDAINPDWRNEYIRQYRAAKRASGAYGYCKQCESPLGRNEGQKGRNSNGFCIVCNTGSNNQNFKGGWINSDGYRVRGHNGRSILEHRLVMQEHLGRDLLPDENVHHINGDRTDNSIKNLELWSTSQPCGQRVVDKIAWAKMILERYDT